MKVLIVEDDFIIQMFLEQMITSINCQVVGTVENSKKALEAVINKQPDLILMDIGIEGETDGVDTAKLIHTIKKIPVIFITGNSDQYTKDRIKTVDAIMTIFKPINERKFKQDLKQVCEDISLSIL